MSKFINSNRHLFPRLNRPSFTDNNYLKEYIKSMESLKKSTSNKISFFKSLKVVGNVLTGAKSE
jgi:hypothetical protein